MTESWLVADLGGTNTRVGLVESPTSAPTYIRSFANKDFDGLASLLSAYLSKADAGSVAALCAGVAGPVWNETAQLTNRDWFIDAAELRAATGAKHVTLVNDLQAQGYALDDVDAANITPLFPGTDQNSNGIRLVLGVGTGCNIAVVHTIGRHLYVPPSETGHTSLPHCDGPIGDLIQHLGASQAHKPIEAALSGPGLQNIWQWLGGGHETSEEILQKQRSGDPTAVQTVAVFCEILGDVAGNIALSHLPMGGVFLIGGLARAIAPYLSDSAFHARFCARGPYSTIMKDIPISLIADDTAALRGCARLLRQKVSP